MDCCIPPSFRDLRTGREWAAGVSTQAAPYPPAALTSQPRRVTFTSNTGVFGPTEGESLIAEVVSAGDVTLTYRFQIFARSAGVSVQLGVSGQPAAQRAGSESAKPASGVEKDQPPPANKMLNDVLDGLALAPRPLKLTQVSLYDQTDSHNELVAEREWLLHPSERVREAGNLFFLEDTLRWQRHHLPEGGARSRTRVRCPTRWISTWPPRPGRSPCSGRAAPAMASAIASIALAYTGGRAGRTEALQIYQRQLRQYDPQRDGMFLSNTWGDRSRDARINSAFMEKEVEAGARLGVDAIQIDDGWQRGRTSNSAKAGGVWNGFWAADPHFWDVNAERFPSGLDPLIASAKTKACSSASGSRPIPATISPTGSVTRRAFWNCTGSRGSAT